MSNVTMTIEEWEQELDGIQNNLIDAIEAAKEALKGIEQTKRFVTKLAIKQNNA